jgi:hypothetical protein
MPIIILRIVVDKGRRKIFIKRKKICLNNIYMDIEGVLENIRINSVYLSKIHKKRYITLKDCLKFYRIPIIIFSYFMYIMQYHMLLLPI